MCPSLRDKNKQLLLRVGQTLKYDKKSKAIQKLSYLIVNIGIDFSTSSIIFEKYVGYCPKMKSKKHNNHLFLHLFFLPNLFTTTDNCLFFTEHINRHFSCEYSAKQFVICRCLTFFKQQLSRVAPLLIYAF